MIDAEKKAFEHAARLAREYRADYKRMRNIAVIEGVIIVILYAMLMWGGFRG